MGTFFLISSRKRFRQITIKLGLYTWYNINDNNNYYDNDNDDDDDDDDFTFIVRLFHL